MEIPDSVFVKYREAADMFINTLGVNCRINYVPTREECENCVFDTFSNKSSNVYKSGGPQPFDIICPYCDGVGYKETEYFENIKLRVNWQRKNFLKFAPLVNIPDNSVQIIGFLYDLPKIQKAINIVINTGQEGYGSFAYTLLGEPVTHGFLNNRYFLAFLTREPDKS
jgi:hypothetical protein